MKTEDGPNQMYAGWSCPVFPAQAMKTKKSIYIIFIFVMQQKC